MKTTIKLLVLFMCLNINAQISEPVNIDDGVEIGRARKNGIVPVLNLYRNDVYMLFYNNLKYTYLKDVKVISFTATKEELDFLYKFFLNGFNSNDTKGIRVGEQDVYVKKVAGSIRVSVFYKYKTDGWFYLSKKQLNRLFGKI